MKVNHNEQSNNLSTFTLSWGLSSKSTDVPDILARRKGAKHTDGAIDDLCKT